MQELIVAVLKTGCGSIGQLLFGIVTMKILAVSLGPSGIGLYSLLKQTLQTAVLTGTFNGQNAVVQGLSSRQGAQRRQYMASVALLFVFGGIVGALLLFFLSPLVCNSVFHTRSEVTIRLVRWISLPMLLGVAFTFVAGVMNAERAIGRLALVQAVNAAATCAIAFPVAKLVRSGAALAFIWMFSLSQLLSLIWALVVGYRAGWLESLFQAQRSLCDSGCFDKRSLQHFLQLSTTTLLTGLVTNGAALLVRGQILQREGYHGVGLFDVAWTVSMIYVTLVLTSFTTYYLPTLSATQSFEERVHLISRVMRFSIATMVPLVSAMIVFRPLLIRWLYSSEFMPALGTMRWMLLGDYFKVTSFVLSISVIAFPKMKVYLWTELGWSAGFLLISRVALWRTGKVDSVGVAFLIMYALYLGAYVYIVAAEHGYSFVQTDLRRWLGGASFLVLVSAFSWHTQGVIWPLANLCVIAAFTVGWFTLAPGDRALICEIVRAQRRRLQSADRA